MAFEPLYQNDPRWKDQVLGHGSSETIGVFGCLLTSMTMVGNYFGGNETPASFNSKMKQKGGFQNQWVRPAAISSVYPNVKYQKRVQCSNQAAPMDEIDAALETGCLVTVMVDRSPAPGIQGHWVILREKKGDDYLIWDPWQSEGTPETLGGRYSHGTPAEIIQDIIWFGGGPLPEAKKKPDSEVTPAQPKAPLKSEQETVADPSLVVHPIVDGLKMRQQPLTTQPNIVKQLLMSARLMPLEPAVDARAKIGQHGEWMHVRDIEGDEGYVAAWYVTPVDDPSLGVQKKIEEVDKPTPRTKLVVQTTTEDVALRTQPRVAEETLIKRLPYPSELLVIEPGDVEQRIGVYNQWLQVRALDGTEGYVAAWYVARG